MRAWRQWTGLKPPGPQPQASPGVAGTRAVLVLRQELARTRRQALARRLEPSAQTDAFQTTPQEHGSDGRTPAESYAAPLQRGQRSVALPGRGNLRAISAPWVMPILHCALRIWHWTANHQRTNTAVGFDSQWRIVCPSD